MATETIQPKKKTKVWKGEKRTGPAPARHIPWPEIFKHHISVVEGHTKMLEMVQKHTVKGTGNYDTITNLVKRGHETLWQAKDVSRSFIPPKNQREMVPLGSSSESMYPGYSPAHIEYGKAAGEFGQAVGQMRARGEKWEPANGTEYEIGQAHGAKRKMYFQSDKPENTRNDGAAAKPSTVDMNEKEPDAEETLGFVIDVNPTPIKLPSTSTKRPLENISEIAEEKRDKKYKKTKEEEPVIETEDISAEVEARLKIKEEKKKLKEEKKRRRESAGDEEKVVKKSKKDKSKKREAEGGEEGSGDGEGKKKKRKKNKETE